MGGGVGGGARAAQRKAAGGAARTQVVVLELLLLLLLLQMDTLQGGEGVEGGACQQRRLADAMCVAAVRPRVAPTTAQRLHPACLAPQPRAASHCRAPRRWPALAPGGAGMGSRRAGRAPRRRRWGRARPHAELLRLGAAE